MCFTDHGGTHNNTHTRTLHQQLIVEGCNLFEIYYALLVTEIRQDKLNRKISTTSTE